MVMDFAEATMAWEEADILGHVGGVSGVKDV